MAKNKFTQSFETLILGMIIGIIAFLMLGYTEGLFYDKNIVRWLPELQDEELVLREDGMLKLSGVPEVRTALKIPEYDKDQVFVKKIIEEKVDGEWVVTRTDVLWANFTLHGVNVCPECAKQYFDLEQKYVAESNTERETMYGIDADAPLIAVGIAEAGEMIEQNMILISNYDNIKLEAEMQALAHNDWWFFKIFAWLLLSIGIVAFLLPVLTFFEILPELGFLGILGFIGICFGFAFLLIVIQTLVFSYWFLIFLILALMLYLFVSINIKKKDKPINLLSN